MLSLFILGSYRRVLHGNPLENSKQLLAGQVGSISLSECFILKEYYPLKD